MQRVFKFIFRTLMLAMALVVAASLIVAILVLMLAWLVRAAWALLTGRPVKPWAMRVQPMARFNFVYRASARSATGMQASEKPERPAVGDVTDVEVRELPRPDRQG